MKFSSLASFICAASVAHGHNSAVKTYLSSVDVSAVAALSDAQMSLPSADDGAPQQLHLSLTGSPSEMFVTFVMPNVSTPCADAGVSLSGGGFFSATHQTYTAGVAGWAGVIYTSRLTGLTPGGAYNYSALACGTHAVARGFRAAPVPAADANARVIVTADMGTVVPLGFAVAAQITRDHAAVPFDLAVLAGDLSYATVSPPKDEFEAVWDAWGRLIDPYTAEMPFM